MPQYTRWQEATPLIQTLMNCQTERWAVTQRKLSYFYFSPWHLAFRLWSTSLSQKKFFSKCKSQTSSADSKRMVQCVLLQWGGKATDRDYCKLFVKQLPVTFFKHNLRTWPPLTITVCVALLEGCNPKSSLTEQNKNKIKCYQTPVYCESLLSKGLLFCVSIAKHRSLH